MACGVEPSLLAYAALSKLNSVALSVLGSFFFTGEVPLDLLGGEVSPLYV